MTSRRPNAAPRSRWHEAVVIAGLYALIVTLTIFKISNDDIWIHLKTGERIIETRQVPHQDPYSFTASDHDYVAHEWLSAVAFQLVYAAAGIKGLTLFKHAVVLMTCFVLYLIARIRGDHLALWMFGLVLMLFVASARFLERPHVFSYLFMALYLLIYFAYREGGKGWALCAVPPLHLVWANMHGGHMTGVFLLVTLAAAELATTVRARLCPRPEDRPLPMREMLKLGALPLLCLAAALVNPYGLRLLTFPFELTRLQVFMRGELGVVEWQSPLHPVYNATAMFLLFVPWVGLLLGVLALSGEEGRLPTWLRAPVQALQLVTGILSVVFWYELARTYRNPHIPSAIEQHATLWSVVALLWVVARLHRIDFVALGISALFLALAFRYNRAVTDAVMATLPVLAHGLSRLWDRFARHPPPALMVPAGGVVALGLAVLTATWGYHFGFDPPSVREGGFGIASNLPVGAVDYLARNHVQGRALNSYDAGALMIHELWPAVRVSMDSRNDVYGEDLYREYRAAFEGGPALEAYLKKRAVDIVVVTNNVPPPFPFLYYLENTDAWAMVYADARSFVYVKRNDRFRDLIARDEPPLLNPVSPSGASTGIR
jgi:hypothetical protein